MNTASDREFPQASILNIRVRNIAKEHFLGFPEWPSAI